MTEPAPPRAKAGFGDLGRRATSALVLAATVLLATWAGGWPFRIVWCLAAGLVAYEWGAMVGRRSAVAIGVAVALAGIAIALLPVSGPAVAGVSALLAILALAASRSGSPPLLEAAGVGYALALALIPPALRDVPVIGLSLIAWSFAVVWTTDVAAYFAGRTFGGPKLMPAVSPKKTWSGAVGGTLAGMLGGYLVWRLAPATGIGPGFALLGAFAASVAGQAGDLYESALKRRFGTKDSSSLIPGHGGFLDRLDAYWAVMVLAGLALFAAAATP